MTDVVISCVWPTFQGFREGSSHCGAQQAAEVCRHGTIVYVRESNHPCSAMTGDHPNPLRRRSKLCFVTPRLRHRVGEAQIELARTVVQPYQQTYVISS